MSSSPDCPDRPADESDLDFEKREMVRWFSPKELVRTGTEAVVSALFGAYADWREIQALRAHDQTEPAEDADLIRTVPGVSGGTNEWYDLSDRDSLWIDYTADLGDGFDATHTVAQVLAQRHLTVDGHDTERGRLLVMGGDQVYPTASRTEYQDRLVGPYKAALPCVTDETPPALFAVPGNHDWYDGLTSFLRLFTQKRWIGGWKTHQRRSYFAIKLPHDWWLWGIDVQLDSDIDEPQLKYFRSIADNDAIMPDGSKVMLCTPEPTWVYAETHGPSAYRNLGYFQDTVLDDNNHELTIGLAGDLHTYARYADDETDEQRFIAGGGGAYLYPSHDLPDDLTIETPSGHEEHFALQQEREKGNGDSVYPDRDTSRGIAWKALLMPFHNIGMGGLVGSLYLLFAWLLESSTIFPAQSYTDGTAPPSLLKYLSTQTMPGKAVEAFVSVLQHTPSAALLAIGLVGGLAAFADAESTVHKLITGLLHAAAHLLLATLLLWGFAHLNFNGLGLGATAGAHVLLLFVEMMLIGGLLGGMLIGLYLIVMNRLCGAHTNEVFSCQHNPHYKNMLRLHVADDGVLTMYPLGVPTVETDWQIQPAGNPDDPWFVGEKSIAERVELIEPPVDVQ